MADVVGVSSTERAVRQDDGTVTVERLPGRPVDRRLQTVEDAIRSATSFADLKARVADERAGGR